jgi:hypothetical protein
MRPYLRLVLCLSVFVPTDIFAQSSEGEHNKEWLALVRTGPVSPDFLRDSLVLPDSALTRYSIEYRQHLTRTKAQREAAIVALKDGDRDGAGRGHRSRAVRALLSEDGSFEHDHLMPLLTPEQRRAVLRPRVQGMGSAMRARTPRS